MVIAADVKQIKQLVREIASDKISPRASEIDGTSAFPWKGFGISLKPTNQSPYKRRPR